MVTCPLFRVLDRLAGRATPGPKWLADERIARLVAETTRIGERERNPVAAGLVESVGEWPWSSRNPAGETACSTSG